jgi:hypothetical protein
MKKFAYIFVFICVISCTKEESVNQSVVSGFFRADNDSVFVEVGALQPDGVFVPSENQNVRISADGNLYSLTSLGNGIYHLNSDIPNNVNQLSLFVNDNISAVSFVPPEIAPISIGNTNLTIDPNSPGIELFGLTWNDVEGYSFVLQLECMEETKVEIPFEVPHGLFDTQFNGPIEESSIDLYDVDFNYYGQHKLTVYIIDSKYSELFFYRSRSKRNVITAGPDNVFGAHGFWACTKAFEILLNIE